MIKTKVREYQRHWGKEEIKVWKIAGIVIWSKKVVDKPNKPA